MTSGSYLINGVAVDRATLGPSNRLYERPPLIFVHGACGGSWWWEKFLPFFANAGWDCHALSWYSHYKSRRLPEDQFLERSIADVREEIDIVASQFDVAPVVVGHSMGGLASQKYAEIANPRALVLLGPGVPAQADVRLGSPPLPVVAGEPWGPPTPEMAEMVFFGGCSEQEMRRYTELLCPESPQALEEVTGRYLNIDVDTISMPTFVIAGENDPLCPPAAAHALATLYQADYLLLPHRDHNMMLGPTWQEAAVPIADWLMRNVPPLDVTSP